MMENLPSKRTYHQEGPIYPPKKRALYEHNRNHGNLGVEQNGTTIDGNLYHQNVEKMRNYKNDKNFNKHNMVSEGNFHIKLEVGNCHTTDTYLRPRSDSLQSIQSVSSEPSMESVSRESSPYTIHNLYEPDCRHTPERNPLGTLTSVNTIISKPLFPSSDSDTSTVDCDGQSPDNSLYGDAKGTSVSPQNLVESSGFSKNDRSSIYRTSDKENDVNSILSSLHTTYENKFEPNASYNSETKSTEYSNTNREYPQNTFPTPSFIVRKDSNSTEHTSANRTSGFIEHAKTHDNKPCKCRICFQSFVTSDLLQGHIKTNHPGDNPYKCEHCSREFSQYNNLRRHIRVHRAKIYKCELCDREFNEEFYLNMHMGTHTGKRVYSCGVCNACFPTSQNLKLHVKTHSPSELHTCEVCGKSFSKACVLRQHKKGHSGERPHKCDKCPKTFIHRHHLTMHLRSHADTKAYTCDICNKDFYQSSHLYKHMRSHEDGSLDRQGNDNRDRSKTTSQNEYFVSNPLNTRTIITHPPKEPAQAEVRKRRKSKSQKDPETIPNQQPKQSIPLPPFPTFASNTYIQPFNNHSVTANPGVRPSTPLLHTTSTLSSFPLAGHHGNNAYHKSYQGMMGHQLQGLPVVSQGYENMYRNYTAQVQAYYNNMYMMNFLSQNALQQQDSISQHAVHQNGKGHLEYLLKTETVSQNSQQHKVEGHGEKVSNSKPSNHNVKGHHKKPTNQIAGEQFKAQNGSIQLKTESRVENLHKEKETFENGTTNHNKDRQNNCKISLGVENHQRESERTEIAQELLKMSVGHQEASVYGNYTSSYGHFAKNKIETENVKQNLNQQKLIEKHDIVEEVGKAEEMKVKEVDIQNMGTPNWYTAPQMSQPVESQYGQQNVRQDSVKQHRTSAHPMNMFYPIPTSKSNKQTQNKHTQNCFEKAIGKSSDPDQIVVRERHNSLQEFGEILRRNEAPVRNRHFSENRYFLGNTSSTAQGHSKGQMLHSIESMIGKTSQRENTPSNTRLYETMQSVGGHDFEYVTPQNDVQYSSQTCSEVGDQSEKGKQLTLAVKDPEITKQSMNVPDYYENRESITYDSKSMEIQTADKSMEYANLVIDETKNENENSVNDELKRDIGNIKESLAERDNEIQSNSEDNKAAPNVCDMDIAETDNEIQTSSEDNKTAPNVCDMDNDSFEENVLVIDEINNDHDNECLENVGNESINVENNVENIKDHIEHDNEMVVKVYCGEKEHSDKSDEQDRQIVTEILEVLVENVTRPHHICTEFYVEENFENVEDESKNEKMAAAMDMDVMKEKYEDSIKMHHDIQDLETSVLRIDDTAVTMTEHEDSRKVVEGNIRMKDATFEDQTDTVPTDDSKNEVHALDLSVKKKMQKADNVKSNTCNNSNVYNYENFTSNGVFNSKADKPFQCDVCLRSFGQKHNLNRHKMSHNAKNYECKVCGRTFKETFYLQMHMKIHSEEKSRNCEICGKLVLKSEMVAHTNSHMGNIVENPTYAQIGHRVKEILKEQNSKTAIFNGNSLYEEHFAKHSESSGSSDDLANLMRVTKNSPKKLRKLKMENIENLNVKVNRNIFEGQRNGKVVNENVFRIRNIDN